MESLQHRLYSAPSTSSIDVSEGELQKREGPLSTCIPIAIFVSSTAQANVQLEFPLIQNILFHSKALIPPNQLQLASRIGPEIDKREVLQRRLTGCTESDDTFENRFQVWLHRGCMTLNSYTLQPRTEKC